MALEIDSRRNDEGTVLICAVGEIDVSCADELRTVIDAELARADAARIEVDLAQVPYIDSTGIGVLVGAVKRAAEAGATLVATNPQRNVRRVLDLLAISGELGLTDDEA